MVDVLDDLSGPAFTPEHVKAARRAAEIAALEAQRAKVIAVDLGRNLDRSVITGLDCHFDRVVVGNVEVYARKDYNALVDRLIEIRSAPAMAGAKLCFDMTGVGLGVTDLFLARGVMPDLGVVITSGTKAHTNRDMTGVTKFNIPKADLVAHLIRLLNEGRIVINRNTPGADVLNSEMVAFQATVRKTGHIAYEAPAGQHDDAVLSLCIGIASYSWFVRRMQRRQATMQDQF